MALTKRAADESGRDEPAREPRRTRPRRGRSTRPARQPGPVGSPGTPSPPRQRRAPRRERLARAWPLLLLRSAHPRQAVLTALGLGGAAALAGRPWREVGLVAAAALVGQVVLGWHNDLVDRDRDRRHDPVGKPVGGGLLDPGTVWFAVCCGVLLVVPLAVSTGRVAGAAYLLALLVGLVGNVALRRGWLSWLPWAVSFALYPAFLSYGGWGGTAQGAPPEIVVTVLAALLGVGVHVLKALPGLVAEHEDGWRSLPLRLGLKLGATRLLVLAGAYTAIVVAGLLVAGDLVGLRQ